MNVYGAVRVVKGSFIKRNGRFQVVERTWGSSRVYVEGDDGGTILSPRSAHEDPRPRNDAFLMKTSFSPFDLMETML